MSSFLLVLYHLFVPFDLPAHSVCAHSSTPAVPCPPVSCIITPPPCGENAQRDTTIEAFRITHSFDGIAADFYSVWDF